MKIKKLEIVRFAPKGKDSFMEAVGKAVNEYFESNRISTYANTEMWVKTAVMLTLYFAPCTLIITGVAAGNPWLFFGFWFLMGIGMTGIGTSVMHDANHGAYSANKRVNNFIGHILELIGGYVANWKIQHNILHHTYTNIAGLDEDIDSIKLLRFSPNQPRHWYHRYQYIYAWFFYMIMTLFWMTVKDYIQVFRYKQHDLLVKQKVTLKTAVLRISLAKVFYYAYILVLPIIFSGMPWYLVLAGFLGMHFVAGLFLSCIFQPAHVIGASAFSLPVEIGDQKRMEDSWAVHEVANTTNYAPRSRILSWFIGGLNYQIEHHLFSGICHVHYRKLAPIVKSITTSFKIPYNVQSNFIQALWAHGKMLKQLGKA
ncbi:linoleoyl-CoA desaturase [Chitinophaga sp. CF118]|uniref:fatty acid desaturase family protein n=1 Tax=Chitinophaga sp. CF118 TaxID=1884367 RepID=UPI0008E085DF|nr:acyl-CoA desaturase [Chitinophaga sp. CF118]SFE97495.1 linoleoyl-CoA desaturase [Chitinophaga sp. CF118]